MEITSPLPDAGLQELENTHITVAEYLLQHIVKHGESICMIDDVTGHVVTYQQLIRDCYRFAAGLYVYGLRPGDRVAVCAPHSVEYPVLWYAILLNRAISVGMMPEWTVCLRSMPKRVAVLKSVSKSEPVPLSCEWEACDEQYDEVQLYLDHITDHLQQLLQFTCDDTWKKQIERGDALLYACYWRGCSHDAFSDFPALMRHVYFHAFHTKVKSIGSKLVEKNNLRECLLDPTTRNLIPDIPERFNCGWQYCDKGFDNPDMFYMHINNHCDALPSGNNVPGGCKCLWDGCSTVVKSKHKLKDHVRSHTQEKLVACPSCGALFSNMTRFYDHLKRQLESDGHSYQCSHCNKKYASERLLKEHMRHHVNYYQCPLCDMTCPNPSNLRLHFRYRHTDSRPFICDLCSHTTKTQNDLRRHQETHKPWIYCEVEDCMYRCHALPDLTRHCKVLHAQLVEGLTRLLYLCHLCNSCYTTGINLTSHLRSKHKFRWPPGHVRFRYKFHNDGYYRLQTVRYESIELTQQILASDIATQSVEVRPPQPTPNEAAVPSGDKPAPDGVVHDIVIGEKDVTSDDYSYNLSLLRDVALNDLSKAQPKGKQSQKKATKKGRVVKSGDDQITVIDKIDMTEKEMDSILEKQKANKKNKSPLTTLRRGKRKRKSETIVKPEPTEKSNKKRSRLALESQVTGDESIVTEQGQGGESVVSEQGQGGGHKDDTSQTEHTIILPSGEKILITSNIPVEFAEPIQVSEAIQELQGVPVEPALHSQSPMRSTPCSASKNKDGGHKMAPSTPRAITIEQTQAAFLGTTPLESPSPRNRIISPKGSLEQKIRELVALRTSNTHSARVNLFPANKHKKQSNQSLDSVGDIIPLEIAPLDDVDFDDTPDITMETDTPNKALPTYMESTPITHGFSSRDYFRDQGGVDPDLSDSDTELDPEINQDLQDAIDELHNESL